jgi:hypothetical protein
MRKRLAHWGSAPYQFACIAAFSAGVARMPGVHSTVWIFAISALLTSRARRNSSSSSHCG